MTVELDRDRIEYQVRSHIRKHLVIWMNSRQLGPADLAIELGSMISEVMFDVASTSNRHSPEAGVLAGVQMVKNWQP